nr:efflux transporter outer membrane subunit [Salinicola tamaricis]
MLIFTLLAGCANYAGISPQATLTPVSRLSAQQVLGETPISPAAWPERAWWRALGDPELNALIDEALADSPDVDAARARLRSANAAIASARASGLPSVDGSAQVSRSRVSEVQDPRGQGNFYSTTRKLMLSFDYDLDLWGGKRAAWRAALGEARAQEIEFHAAALTLSVNVARAYVSLAHAFELRDIANRQLDRAQRIDAINRELQQAGLDNQLQSLQSQVTVANARQTLEAAEQSIRSQRISLATLLGKGPDRGQSIPRPRDLAPAIAALPSVIPAELIGHRPDVIAARWRVEAASQRIKQAKAKFYPNLDLTAMAGFQSPLGDYFFSEAAKSASVTPAISLPIFDGGRLRANLESSDADYDLAVSRYKRNADRGAGGGGRRYHHARFGGSPAPASTAGGCQRPKCLCAGRRALSGGACQLSRRAQQRTAIAQCRAEPGSAHHPAPRPLGATGPGAGRRAGAGCGGAPRTRRLSAGAGSDGGGPR